ncbi:MAG TPA: choice-of-anchor J domain-containing protein, partial [Candidatus Cloacimonadota bacterium]|nr:choice-of-anchor J domain-containing protein [Candidatus Cloacimonadota bacterium]
DGTAHTGLQSAASASWTGTTGALNPDNWLITPPIAIPATGEYLVEYYVGAQDPDYPDDHYGFYVSTTGTAPADFSLLFEETLMDGAWYYRSQNLASYAGQTVHFAFRHFDSYDWFYMKIDDVTVRKVPEAPILSISPEAWDFGTLQVMNPGTPKSFLLSNVGTDTIDILAGDIQLTDDAEGNFVLVAENLPAALSGSTTYAFTVQFIPQSVGSKTATVTIQDNLTRVLHTIELSGEAIPEPIASVVALQGTVEAQVNARLNWASIYGDPTQAGYVHWDDSIQRGNVGAGATPFHAVAKYGTEVTALATGKVLDGVMIHIAEEPQLITSVKVWTGTDADLAPLTMVHEETVSDLTVGWNYVALTTPVPITGTDAIYVGFYSTGMADVFPGSTDGLTAVDGRGNVVELGGAWNTLTGFGIAGSWLIHAHFADAAPIMAGRRPVVLQNVAVNNVEMTDEALRNSPVKARMNGNVDRVLRGFNVYRDGVQINSEIVAAYTYLDEGLAADTYDYAAQAVHYSANGPISGTIPVTVDPPADPIALPFLEDWASSGYDTNMWSIGSSNWGMNTTTGNPAPSASFSWSPRVYDYNSILASYEFDATGIASVRFSFDLYLNNYSTDAENTMTWEVWDGSAWNTLGSYSSLDDDLGWTTYAYDISAYAANRVFKIRFVAAGEDSYGINYWYLDN